MSKFRDWSIRAGDIDLLVGGTPCQSFSVAGLRQGLKDPRGNLMLTFLAIAEHLKPKWIVWENVPGVLSSNGGKDFGSFLGGLGQLGYGFAYRILDAQWCRTHGHPRAVPQRRRRVFVVGCLGDWRSAAKVLFESESLCRDITPSRKEKQKITEDIVPIIANCLQTTCNDYSRADGFNIVPMGIYNNISDTVTAKFSKGAELLQQGAKNGGNCIFHPMPLEPKSYGIPGNWIGRKPENGGNATTPMDDIAPCLTKTDIHGVSYNMKVRRLTPIECERLQGFPDNYTNTPTSSDTTRYKALGNSMAVPVMKWIGQRINELS